MSKVEIEALDMKISDMLTKEEQKIAISFLVSMRHMDFKKRLAVLTFVLLEHKHITDTKDDEFMAFMSSLFHGMILNAPDCEAKSEFINECTGILETLRPTSGKAN